MSLYSWGMQCVGPDAEVKLSLLILMLCWYFAFRGSGHCLQFLTMMDLLYHRWLGWTPIILGKPTASFIIAALKKNCKFSLNVGIEDFRLHVIQFHFARLLDT